MNVCWYVFVYSGRQEIRAVANVHDIVLETNCHNTCSKLCGPGTRGVDVKFALKLAICVG